MAQYYRVTTFKTPHETQLDKEIKDLVYTNVTDAYVSIDCFL